MRFNTKKKREKIASEVEEFLIQSYYINFAQEIVKKWVEGGLKVFQSEIVKEDMRIALCVGVYNLKGKNK